MISETTIKIIICREIGWEAGTYGLHLCCTQNIYPTKAPLTTTICTRTTRDQSQHPFIFHGLLTFKMHDSVPAGSIGSVVNGSARRSSVSKRKKPSKHHLKHRRCPSYSTKLPFLAVTDMPWYSRLFSDAAMQRGSPSHPYYPLDAAIEGYVPNTTPILDLLISAGGACLILLSTTFALISYVRPTLRMADRIAILWFVLCMYQ